MDLAERNRLIAVTKGYRGLQGLLTVPWGILNVLMNVANASVHGIPQRSLAAVGAFLALVLCAFAAFFAAWIYYRRRFGVVRSKCPGGLNALLLTLAAIVAIVTLLGAMYMDGSFDTNPVTSYPVSLTCLWWALYYVFFTLAPYGLRPHSIWFATLFFALCFLTQMGVVPKNQFLLGSGRTGALLIWLAFSLHGLLDHLRLLRLLPKVSPEPSTSQSSMQSGERHG